MSSQRWHPILFDQKFFGGGVGGNVIQLSLPLGGGGGVADGEGAALSPALGGSPPERRAQLAVN